MLEFRVEWEDAQSVRSKSLAATWGKIEIHAGGHVVTRFWSALSNSVRNGVYASAFPLAAWIVRNWWNLLYERIPTPDVLRGARHGTAHHRSWLERHNLFYSREGMAFPDFLIYREDDLVGLRWVSDPEVVTTPGRFIDSGFYRLDVRHAAAALTQIVDAVLERLDGIHDDESDQLRADWQGIQDSLVNEPGLCSRLGELGLDPYDEAADESTENMLEEEHLPGPLLADLLVATNPLRLKDDLIDLRVFLDALPDSSTSSPRPVRPSATLDTTHHYLPYRAGYARAESLRKHLGLDRLRVINDLSSIISDAVGPIERSSVPLKTGRRVEAAIEKNGVFAMAAEPRSTRSFKFLFARALHHWLFVNSTSSSLRLLTRANDWQQAASRAFAAELLAPAAALAARLDGRTDWEATEDLAAEFGVDQMVIAHQLENHNLG